MLALPRRAIDDRNAVRLGVASRAPAEPAGQTHQMGVIQGFVRSRQRSPPHAETARTMPRPEIAIQNDAIHAIVAAVKQLSIEFAQSVCHAPFSRGDAERRIHATPAYRLQRAFREMWRRLNAAQLPRRGHFFPAMPGGKRRLFSGAWRQIDGEGFKGYIRQVKLWGVLPRREDR